MNEKLKGTLWDLSDRTKEEKAEWQKWVFSQGFEWPHVGKNSYELHADYYTLWKDMHITYSGRNIPTIHHLTWADYLYMSDQDRVIDSGPRDFSTGDEEVQCTCTGTQMLSGMWADNCGYHNR